MYYNIKLKMYKRVYSDCKRPSLTSIPGPTALFDSVTSRDILYICLFSQFSDYFHCKKEKGVMLGKKWVLFGCLDCSNLFLLEAVCNNCD